MHGGTDGRVRLWMAAQAVALAATLGVIGGLFVAPRPTLAILWGLVIPLVPASLLVSPMLWRNVCPLATLEMPWTGSTGRRVPGVAGLTRGAVVGMALLGLLVPARHVTFNGANPTDGTALGVVIVLVAVAALALGRLFDAKAGFCNTVCPVLPVERLYGQSPLLGVSNPRCLPCTACTKVGCIDLGAARSIPQVLAKSPPGRAWYLTHYGAFAAAFPGFVLGYYLAPDGPPATAAAVFGTVAFWTAASFALVSAVAFLGRVPARHAMPALAAAAVSLYYWFAGPVLSATLGLGTAGGMALRAAAYALIACWLWVAYARVGRGETAGAWGGTTGSEPPAL